ncbi:MAG: hypothetical protein M3Q23_17260 [Actinomycetota bacterium]|nr:hypothetical protein [Actinomycetota bacterium]
MIFRWEYLDADGRTVGRSEPFGERVAAEDWMGQAWEDLVARGIEEVALRDEVADRTIYRMGLGSQ